MQFWKQFPWKKLYNDYQIGMWYDDATKTAYADQLDVDVFTMQMTSSPFIFKYQNSFVTYSLNICVY